MARIRMLLQHDTADINAESIDGKTLLYHVCHGTKMSDSDQYDAIMLLLTYGADPKRGHILSWLVLRFYSNQCNESEFITLFCSLIDEYGTNVHHPKHETDSLILKALYAYFYASVDSVRTMRRTGFEL
jgi:hypothetical protein